MNIQNRYKSITSSKVFPVCCVIYCFLIIWLGESGSYLWGGLAAALSLFLVPIPEYLLLPLFSSILLNNNCFLLPDVTASRYFTLLFIAAQGLQLLLRREIKASCRRFLYPAVLLLYFAASAFFLSGGIHAGVITIAMNIILAAMIGSLGGERLRKIMSLLPFAAIADLSYLYGALISGTRLTITYGRYWLLGMETNINNIAMILAQLAILYFGYSVFFYAKRATRSSFLYLLFYFFSLYLLVLTGARSSLFGLAAGCFLLGLLLLRTIPSREDKKQVFAVLLLLCLLSAAEILATPYIQQNFQSAPLASDPLPSDPLPSDPLPSDPLPSDPLPSDPLPSDSNVQIASDYWHRVNPLDEYWGQSAGRTDIWKILVEKAILSHPLFGVGYGNVSSILQANNDSHSGAHNILVGILAALGLVGLLLLAIPLIRLLIRSLKLLQSNPILFPVLGLIFTALATGIGEDIYTERFLWFAIGLNLCLLEQTDAWEQDRSCQAAQI